MRKSANNTVLVIDDESQIRRFVGIGLGLHGYRVSEAANGALGLSILAENDPDVVILDLGLPDMSGIEVLRTIRSWSNVPVIVLSIEIEEQLKVQLLKGGADDYITKPFGIDELAARCEVVLRRFHKTTERDSTVRSGPLAIDFAARAVTLNGRHIKVTPNEYRLLHLLASHLGLVVTHHQLVKDMWGESEPGNVTQYLRMLVRNLRKKLEPDPGEPKLLISEFGIGYRLCSLDIGGIAVPGGTSTGAGAAAV
jgi:two-component system, OmpR family, KDP operon response regulator KdpE